MALILQLAIVTVCLPLLLASTIPSSASLADGFENEDNVASVVEDLDLDSASLDQEQENANAEAFARSPEPDLWGTILKAAIPALLEKLNPQGEENANAEAFVRSPEPDLWGTLVKAAIPALLEKLNPRSPGETQADGLERSLSKLGNLASNYLNQLRSADGERSPFVDAAASFDFDALADVVSQAMRQRSSDDTVGTRDGNAASQEGEENLDAVQESKEEEEDAANGEVEELVLDLAQDEYSARRRSPGPGKFWRKAGKGIVKGATKGLLRGLFKRDPEQGADASAELSHNNDVEAMGDAGRVQDSEQDAMEALSEDETDFDEADVDDIDQDLLQEEDGERRRSPGPGNFWRKLGKGVLKGATKGLLAGLFKRAPEQGADTSADQVTSPSMDEQAYEEMLSREDDNDDSVASRDDDVLEDELSLTSRTPGFGRTLKKGLNRKLLKKLAKKAGKKALKKLSKGLLKGGKRDPGDADRGSEARLTELSDDNDVEAMGDTGRVQGSEQDALEASSEDETDFDEADVDDIDQDLLQEEDGVRRRSPLFLKRLAKKATQKIFKGIRKGLVYKRAPTQTVEESDAASQDSADEHLDGLRSPLLFQGPFLKQLIQNAIDSLTNLPLIKNNPMLSALLPMAKAYIQKMLNSPQAQFLTGQRSPLLFQGPFLKQLLQKGIDSLANLPLIKNNPVLSALLPMVKKMLDSPQALTGLRSPLSAYAADGASARNALLSAAQSLIRILRTVPEVRSNAFLLRVVGVLERTVRDAIFSPPGMSNRLGRSNSTWSPSPLSPRSPAERLPWVTRKLMKMCCKSKVRQEIGSCPPPRVNSARSAANHGSNLLAGVEGLVDILEKILGLGKHFEQTGKAWWKDQRKRLCCSTMLGSIHDLAECRQQALTN